jgi:hypothetical protein
VSWKTANLMLNKLRLAMADRDAKYQLTGTVELDGAYVGGKDTGGKRRFWWLVRREVRVRVF